MEGAAAADLLCDHYHLTNEWQRAGCEDTRIWYRHRFSPQQAELILREGVSLRQLDIYSAREVYNFPFCPRLYRYSTTHNACLQNDLSSSLRLLLERVPNRLHPNAPLAQSTKRLLRAKLQDLVSAFQYLHRRFGPFQASLDLIGWTDLKVIKVWIHPDYASNVVKLPLGSEEAMVRSLMVLLHRHGVVKGQNLGQFTTFQEIISRLASIKGRSDEKEVGIEVGEGFDRQLSSLERQSPSEQEKVRNSGKNVASSCSNIGTHNEIYSFKTICANIRSRHRQAPTSLTVSTDLAKSKSIAQIKNLHFQAKRMVTRLSVDSNTHSLFSNIWQDRSKEHVDQSKDNEGYPRNKENMRNKPKLQLFSHTCEGFNRQVEGNPRKGGKANPSAHETSHLSPSSPRPAPFETPSPKPRIAPHSQVQDDLDALFLSNKSPAYFDSSDLRRELDGLL